MNRIKIGSKTGKTIQIVMGMLAIFYGVYAFSLLILGSNYRSIGISWSRTNWVPFKTISIYLFNPYGLSWGLIFDNLIGNLLVFMPLGFLIAFFLKKMRKIISVIILSFVVSTLVEITQGILGVGSVDIDDVILNTLGGLVGLLCFLISYKVLAIFFDWGSLSVIREKNRM
jgi:glycopeptide antibiotics resistance protein